MQRILRRYLPAYPVALGSMLRANGHRLTGFVRDYVAIASSSQTTNSRQLSGRSATIYLVAFYAVLLGALVWLVSLWTLLTPLTSEGTVLLAAYSAIWLYAMPVLATLIVAIGAMVSHLIARLVTPSGLKAMFRGWVARRLEAQVVRLIRERDPLVVAVTGSVGKTSTKLAIAHVLSARYRVLAHQGNYNSEVGLPLAIFELDVPQQLTNPFKWLAIFVEVRRRRRAFAYDAVVLELGADQPGDISKFMRYIVPHIGVLTAIAPVHTEQFGTLKAILDEKWALARGSQRVLLNADDELLAERSAELPEGVVRSFGLDGGDWRFSALRLGKNGYEAKLLRPDGRPHKVKTHLVARHSLYALISAAAVADWSSVPARDICKQLESWQPVRGRMNPLKGKNGSLILDDTYNSSSDAAIAALDALYALDGRHIAILGSMNELGEYEAAGHAKVGTHCGKLDYLVTIGQAANEYLAPAARKAGLKAKQVATFLSPYDAGEYIAGLLRKGDTILAKGSQNGVFAEEAVKLLLADPSDIDRLVRQSPEWLATKESQFPSA